MQGADFSEAKLDYCDFSGCLYDSETIFDDCIYESGYESLAAEEIYGKLGTNANLTDADLEQANLSNAQTWMTIFCNTIMPDGTIRDDGCTEEEDNEDENNSELSDDGE